MGIINAVQGPPTTEKDRRLAWVGRVQGRVSHRTNGEGDGGPGGQIDTNKILTYNEPATLNLRFK